jgi:hypothetical protein
MLIPKRFWEPIRQGEVTVTFRRWGRSQVLAGRVYRTAAGRLRVDAVEVVDPAAITGDEATLAGYPDAATLVADLRGEPGQPVFRIRFHYLDEPDPRSELAAEARLSQGDVADITRRLDRLDRASSHGPWTMDYLEIVERFPERRAPDLAAIFGRETQPFKIDVRKLKNLGLTLSLRIGYRLSPRGEAYLDARRSSNPARAATPDGPT